MNIRATLSGQQPVRRTVHVKNMRAVGEPVNKSGDHGCVFKQFRPFGEWKIGCHNRTGSLTSVGQDFEQQIRLIFIETQVA